MCHLEPYWPCSSCSRCAPSEREAWNGEAVSCFGGILRPLELESTPKTFIDDAWVRGLFDEKSAEVHVAVGGARSCATETGGARSCATENADAQERVPPVVRVTIDGRVVEQTIKPTNYQTIKIQLADFRPWSPEHPNLYTGIVELVESGVVVHTRRERFGVSKFEVRGKDFYLNGKPFFMLGCGFHEIDPIYGRHLPRRDYCRARIAKARAAGFNFARLHTRCESPEFFEAADELGLMLQAELPYYGDHPTCMAPFEPLADAKELWENFRRHPSFAVYCGGNEGTYGPVLGKRFYSFVKGMDPDRLVIEQDTMAPPPWKRDGDAQDLAKFHVSGTDDFISFPDDTWGKYDPPCPMIVHEFLNFSVKSDTHPVRELWRRRGQGADCGLVHSRQGRGARQVGMLAFPGEGEARRTRHRRDRRLPRGR